MSSIAPLPAGDAGGSGVSVVEDVLRRLLGELDADAVRGMLESPPVFEDLPRVASVDVERMPEHADGIRLLKVVDRQQAKVDALRLRTVVEVVGPTSSCDSMLERQYAHEVAVGLRVGKGTAERLIHRARVLCSDFPQFVDALDAGEVVLAHCLAMVDETVHVTDSDALAVIGRRALPRAKRRTPGEFRGIVRELVALYDIDAAARRERATVDRGVRVSYLPDGMAMLSVIHERVLIDAMAEAIVADGEAIQERAKDQAVAAVASGAATLAEAREQIPTADQARADAAVTRILGSMTEDGALVFDRGAATSITAEVVIDLETLLGLRDSLCTVDGEPVPAATARDLLEDATWWRRVVTDPVDGHLLDYGDRTYLPQALKRFVTARDRCCRSCGSRRNLQLDHAVAFPAGSSSTANTGLLCLECHQRKTAGLLKITDSKTDGSATFETAWGQRFRVRPRPYLPDPDRDALRDTEPDPPPQPPATPIPRPPQDEAPPF